MRKINGNDIFDAMIIIHRAKLDESFKELVNGIAEELEKNNGKISGTNERRIGINAIINSCAAIPEARKEFFALIGNIAECDDVAMLPIKELKEILNTIAKENDLSIFFDSVSHMIGRD